MSIADKLQTVAENEKKIHDEVVGQSDLIAQIKAKVNSLPEAGAGGEKPTLFAPTIELNSVSSILTITDNSNGDFAVLYDLYAGGEFITTLSSKTATLADYIEHTETIEIKVQAVGEKFKPSDYSNALTWKYENVEGTLGLAYSSTVSSAVCEGIGDAIETDIVIASIYDGLAVRYIASEAFADCKTITSVVIPNNVISIGSYAFIRCFKLTSINIPDEVTSIGEYAFKDCTSITTIKIPNSVKVLNKMVFGQCSRLESVTIGSGVTNIQAQAFYYCNNLKRVDFSSHTSIPTLNNSNVFSSTHADLQIKVPASLIDEWKAATNWSTYASKIVTEFTNTL